ncbi:SMP-30/gluconolactonase/LRE family protein [Lewinella sp. IMCC34183]|uniref:SMP-30/gluconolactonase/LRE family protein n=1 Tax=Lewinella sp. IMCC34183 TaxID=2248762 RepID=UPI000E21FBE4|nr:superoxide dismutase [Lewinella sp. IMCC34183]
MTLFRTGFLTLLAAFVLTGCTPDPATDLSGQEVTFRKAFPEVLPLPDGFQPEGIVAGTGNDFYVGSLADGSIYRGDFRTGEGSVIFTPESGVSVGLAFDPQTKYLYVAGGPGGGAYVLDTRSREVVESYAFDGGFVNDVILTPDAAYFTESFAGPFLYAAELTRSGQPTGDFETRTLTGDYTFVSGGFNANGIEATPSGDALIVVNSSLGTLYRVDPETGVAQLIDLGGETVVNGDGLLLLGKTLYVVQNQFNQIAEIRLSPDYLSGAITDILTDEDFRVPTTVTRKGSTLYAVNARFGTPAGPNVDYEVVAVTR